MSRRERQIMDIVYRRGWATASEVLDDLPDPPAYSAVRGAAAGAGPAAEQSEPEPRQCVVIIGDTQTMSSDTARGQG